MRVSTALLALSATAAAQQQIPLLDQLKGWFNKASISLSSALPNLPSSIPNPVAPIAAKVAKSKVVPITLDNWKSVLKPGAATAVPGIETWYIFVTGGNKTCFGLCARSELAFNESVVLIETASRNPPNFGMINCEQENILCHSWVTHPPQVLYMQLPQPLPDQSQPASTVRSINVNRTAVTGAELASLHLQSKFHDFKPYESIFQPFDGLLAKTGLQLPFGYVSWGFAQIPSWMLMIGFSMLSRNFM